MFDLLYNVPYGVDIVYARPNAVLVITYVVEVPGQRADSPCIASHVRLGHADIGIDITLAVGYVNGVDGIGLGGPSNIDNVELGNVTLAYDGDGSRMFAVVHAPRGLDADDVVLTLVADNVFRRNVYQLDGLGHDDMGCHLLVDIDNVPMFTVVEDVSFGGVDTLDIMNLGGVGDDVIVFLGLGKHWLPNNG